MDEMNREKFNKIAKDIAEMVIKKNEMYGDSVFSTGEIGIFVRLIDKFERMKHIVFTASRVYYDKNERFNLDIDQEYNEALTDTILDICGYSLLWIYQKVTDKEKKE